MCADSPAGRTFALAITGASGALYATRTMAALLERDCHLEVVISDYGRRLLRDELGETASVDKLRDYLVATYGDGVGRGTFDLLSNKDLGATIASGSHACEGMETIQPPQARITRANTCRFSPSGRASRQASI